jgi:hypothetical protein
MSNTVSKIGVSIADENVDVLLTGSRFHRAGCKWLKAAKHAVDGRLWQTYYLVIHPCQTCWPSRFVARWNNGLRSRHRNCSPHTVMDSRRLQANKRTVGRPRSLSETGLRRVLSRGREGAGYMTIVGDLRRAGIDVSRAAVQRAINRKPPYDDPNYDHIYRSVSKGTV